MRFSAVTTAVAVSCLVVLSGCQVPLLDDWRDDRSEYDVPDRYPPGVSQRGVEDAGALVRNHSGVLADRSWTINERRSVRSENGSVRLVVELSGRIGGNGGYHWIRTTDGSEPTAGAPNATRSESWSNGSVAVGVIRSGNGSDYYRLDSLAEPSDRSDRLNLLFSTLEPDSAGTRILDGDEMYVVTANRSSGPDWIGIFDTTAVRNLTFVAVIDERGLVRGYRLAYDAEWKGRTIHVDRQVRFSAVGSTTVERPDWVETALNRTAVETTGSS